MLTYFCVCIVCAVMNLVAAFIPVALVIMLMGVICGFIRRRHMSLLHGAATRQPLCQPVNLQVLPPEGEHNVPMVIVSIAQKWSK